MANVHPSPTRDIKRVSPLQIAILVAGLLAVLVVAYLMFARTNRPIAAAVPKEVPAVVREDVTGEVTEQEKAKPAYNARTHADQLNQEVMENRKRTLQESR